MEGQYTYEDFDLLIEPGAPGSYRARVVRSPAGESALVQFAVPFLPVELENVVLRVGRPRHGTRGPGRPESGPLKEFGGKLYGAVFQDELRDMLLTSLRQTRALGVGLRLRLRMTDTPELVELPWEFLYDPRLNRFLAQSRHTPLVRYLDLADPPRPLSVEGPLRLLVMISSPTDYPGLDVEREWSALTGALAQQQADGQVKVERLTANMSILRKQLRREAFHVFHFVGHGRYRSDWGDGVLVMEDRNGRPHEVTGEELGGLLNEYDTTRLAVLNACEGARSGVSDPFAGVAQSLIQQGLPTVVAMQFEITDDAAIIFAREFYGTIADGYPLEAALAEARGAIRDEGNLTEWGTPVLYSRAPDGRLFNLTARGRSSVTKPSAHEEAFHSKAQENADHKALAEIRPRPAKLPEIFARYRAEAEVTLTSSFLQLIARIRAELPGHLKSQALPSGGKYTKVFQLKKLYEEAAKTIGDFVAAQIGTWCREDVRAELVPILERLGNEIAEVGQLDEFQEMFETQLLISFSSVIMLLPAVAILSPLSFPNFGGGGSVDNRVKDKVLKESDDILVRESERLRANIATVVARNFEFLETTVAKKVGAVIDEEESPFRPDG